MLLDTLSATAVPGDNWDIATVPAQAPTPTWPGHPSEMGAATGSAPIETQILGGLAERLRSWAIRYSLVLSATSEQNSAVWGFTNLAFPIAAATIQQQDEKDDAEKVVRQLFRHADSEFLEDGMTGWLGDRLWLLLSQHGILTVQALAKVLLQGGGDAVTASHILRWVGRIHDRGTFGGRLHLLTSALQSQFSLVRDGAALGLGEMESPQAIPALRDAINREHRPGLRKDMERVLEHLEQLR